MASLTDRRPCSDESAAEAVAQAEAAANAAAALAAQQAQAVRALVQQQAAAKFNARVQTAILAGDGTFTGDGLLNRVWRKTKQDAPHSENSSVSGTWRAMCVLLTGPL